MNTFANSLFAFLFGWFRSLVQGIWSAAARGEFSRFFVWLGDHWLLIAGLVCLACTVLDYLVWLIRWRPYWVWRTRLRGLMRRLRGEKVDGQRRFSRGYAEGVSLEMPEAPPAPVSDWEQAAACREAEWQIPPPADVPVVSEAPSDPSLLPREENAPPHRYFPPAAGYQPPPVSGPGWAEEALPVEMPVARRRRRSDKYDRRRATWHERLMGSAEEEDALLDGLPPAVSREDAFREPVYPARETPGYDAWQRPGNHTNGK